MITSLVLLLISTTLFISYFRTDREGGVFPVITHSLIGFGGVIAFAYSLAVVAGIPHSPEIRRLFLMGAAATAAVASGRHTYTPYTNPLGQFKTLVLAASGTCFLIAIRNP